MDSSHWINISRTCEYSGDYNQLLYLRARFYAPSIGHFLTKDTWQEDKWGYAGNNPINYRDPSGHSFEPPQYLGPEQFMECFAYHTALRGNVQGKSAGEVVQVCKNAFRPYLWTAIPFNLHTAKLPTSAHDLFGRYLYESYKGQTDWLKFDANEMLTRELATGTLVNNVRTWYYSGGDQGGHTTPSYRGGDTNIPILYHFNDLEFLGTMLFDNRNSIEKRSLPIEFVLGSFKFQVKKVGADRLGFRIDNDMTLESGTHIAGRDPGKFQGSVEELIERHPYLADRPLSEVVNRYENGFQVISILKSQTTDETQSTVGGGSLYQTFAWTERYDCDLAWRLPYQVTLPLLNIQRWGNYASMTMHPGDPFP